MTRSHETRFALVVLLSLCSISCMAPVRSTGSLETGWQAMQPIRARVLLMIPAEFEGFTYAHPHKGGAIRLELGRTAADQLDRLLSSAFTSTSVMPVESESVARDMISREAPELRPYDHVAVPRFMGMTSWDKGFEVGFDVDVVLEISSFDAGRVEKIRGHGESRTPVQTGSSPEQSARVALSYAMDAIKDGLETRRGALSR